MGVKVEDLFGVISGLSGEEIVDYSGATLGTKEDPYIITGNLREITLERSRGYVIIKTGGLVIRIDASGSEFDLLQIDPDTRVISLDCSNSRIKKFISPAKHVFIQDWSGSKRPKN